MNTTYPAYCITKTYNNGEKVYFRNDSNSWTSEPTLASFYIRIKEAEEDLQYILDYHKQACKFYKYTKGVSLKSPKYKIENVSITFLGEIKED